MLFGLSKAHGAKLLMLAKKDHESGYISTSTLPNQALSNGPLRNDSVRSALFQHETQNTLWLHAPGGPKVVSCGRTSFQKLFTAGSHNRSQQRIPWPNKQT
jgi:hypothetical protein